MRTRALVVVLLVAGALAGLFLWGLEKENSHLADPSELSFSAAETQSVPPASVSLPPDHVLRSDSRTTVDRLEDLTRWPEEALIDVRTIAEETGKPLSDVHVTLYVKGPEGFRSEETNRKGSARIPAPCGEILRLAVGARIAHGGQSVKIDPLAPGDHYDVEFTLPTVPDLPFNGIVIDRDSREPVFMARATAAVMEGRRRRELETNKGKGTAFHQGTPTDQAVTLPDGSFSLLVPSWGRRLHLRIEADGYTPAVMPMDWDFQTVEEARVIELKRAATLKLEISGATNGPVSKLKVLALTQPHHLEHRRSENERVGSSHPIWIEAVARDGSCLFEELPSEVPILITIHKGKLPPYYRVIGRDDDPLHRELLPVVLMPGESREKQIVIGSGVTIRGRMVDLSGTPFPGHTALLAIPRPGKPKFMLPWLGVVKNAETDEEGKFVFRDVPPGTWWIGPAQERSVSFDPKQYQAVSLPQEVEVPAGVDAIDVELCFMRGLRISGVVLDASGRPVLSSRPGRLEVSVSAHSEFGVKNARCDDEGAFSLGPLPRGLFELHAFWHYNASYARAVPVTVAAGERGVRLQFQSAGILEGTVVDASTGEPCDAELYVSDPSPYKGTRWGRADRDGLFRIERLPPGNSSVFARSKDGRVGFLRNVEIFGGSETSDLVVPVQEQGYIRLVVPPDGIRWRAMVYAEEMRIGALTPWMPEFAVPVGELTLELDGVRNAGDSERTVMIEAGKTTEVVFE